MIAASEYALCAVSSIQAKCENALSLLFLISFLMVNNEISYIFSFSLSPMSWLSARELQALCWIEYLLDSLLSQKRPLTFV